MSSALALEFMQVWFRDKMSWDHTKCGVQHNALPSLNGGHFFMAFDEGGVTSGNPQTDSLKEQHSFTVGIWKRPEHLTKDLRHTLKMPQDVYLAQSWTLYTLERAAIVSRNATVSSTSPTPLYGLHLNYLFLRMLNEYYNLPDGEIGAEFITPLYYRGRGPMEIIDLADEGDSKPNAWYGYRLRFEGLVREQKLRSSTDALG